MIQTLLKTCSSRLSNNERKKNMAYISIRPYGNHYAVFFNDHAIIHCDTRKEAEAEAREYIESLPLSVQEQILLSA